MMPMGIPTWNAQGVLPPIDTADPTSPNRSPYVVRLSDVVQRFGMTAERLTILDGFLRYRAALHTIGLIQGFQWLDGSFLENVELLEGRPPNDIDVVTFYRLPSGETQATLSRRSPGVFDRHDVKRLYHVDAYVVGLDAPSERIAAASAYWYSVWSHRRNGAWKGYLQIDLAPFDDASGRQLLAALRAAGAQP